MNFIICIARLLSSNNLNHTNTHISLHVRLSFVHSPSPSLVLFGLDP